MKVFVAGATGAIGKPLVQELRKRGHDVVGLARSEANERILRELGATPARADLFDALSLARAIEGCDAVVRTATHISTRARPSARDWAQNDRVRREGTRALLDAAERAGVGRYVQESIVWLARPDDGSAFDERAPPRPDRITQSALDAERLAQEATLPSSTLRLGWIYGRDTAHTRQFATMLRRRMLPVIGDGSARLSYLHVRDAARAFADALEKDARGIFHVVDDEPAPIGDLLDAFAAAVGAPRPMRVPRWLGTLGAGPYIARFLTTPLVTRHDAFTAATGWRPQFPTYREGLAELKG